MTKEILTQKKLFASYLFDLSKIVFTTFVIGGIINYNKIGFLYILIGFPTFIGLAMWARYVVKMRIQQRKDDI
ncbi:MAG TPA: hypothetical protein DCX25_04975 [Candidatus Pacebacteria bacterium]|nr:MAG: hypothetical protein UX00_C0006G0045 [Microgenomates group bacterium GW2011_GWB1_45_17]KKU22726.1 MAG: hypothetical protein UX35_C0017G0005 [Microgenomates group bacterium GW2011_GWA1_46_15]KKU23704.1 MAG: hypothetical protein UX36_C0003G0004 [Microgenomates group bacterium GW2011_GWC1_46_15]HAV15652.1 hypothetical protein [Candidatus Paceibacterota bacterium]HCR11262.1 hypothetical protein [Candidatus Paceibacterota bacterium]